MSTDPSAARGDRAIIAWLAVCCAMLVFMIVLGGLTRLTDSGLSITEWRPVTGALPPLSEAAWQAEFAKYRLIPEYREINRGMTLEQFKTIYWWEYAHRLWGRLIGLAFALPLAWFWFTRRLDRGLMLKLGGILVLGGAQGAMGWYMVASGLVDRVDVSQYRLAAHLALAIVIYGAMFWVLLDLIRPPPASARGSEGLAAALTILVFATMVAGAFVAGLDAGLVYNTFPLMDGALVPDVYGALSPWWRNLFENEAAVQFNHRVLGVSVVALAILSWWRARQGDNATRVVLALALAQMSLGIATLVLGVPLILAALHQAGAIALLTACLAEWHARRGSSAVTPLATARSATPRT
jgi:cytochrome c oxidase assembly protein subunit 15